MAQSTDLGRQEICAAVAVAPEFAGKINLIYSDPPFDTGANFSFTATVPDHPDTPENDSFSFTKEPSLIEQKAYRDTWGRDLDSYLKWFTKWLLIFTNSCMTRALCMFT